MTIMRWNPAVAVPRDVENVRNEVDRLFEGLFGNGNRSGALGFAPRVDIEETPEEFVLRADLPGVPKEDVKLTLTGDTLTIRGERKLESRKKEGTLHRVERPEGSFERSFVLGTPVRNDQVKAVYRDGVLEVHVPKAEEARVREIEVEVQGASS